MEKTFPLPYRRIGGLDEVGYGALAGPLLAVVTVFETPDSRVPPINGIKDSKKFSDKSKMRPIFRNLLRCPQLLQFGIGYVTATEFTRVGPSEAHALAFDRAVFDLSPPYMPEFIIVDGDYSIRSWPAHRQVSAPKADSTYWMVGAASIIAKVIRDDHMAQLAKKFSGYSWESNVGYHSAAHLEGVRRYGMTPHHRIHYVESALASAAQAR